MKYTICSTTELANFARDRKLQVAIHHRSSTDATPKRQDYIRALQKADKTPTFPLLDLSPELRNRVYGELLVCKDSFHCQPNILATCQQIKTEASGVLYGDNLFEVKIWQDGVYANGQKCGEYDLEKLEGPDFTQLLWPGFLRRAQWLEFKLGADFVDKEGTNRPASIENALYSMCKFLSKGHSLRSLSITLDRKDATGTPITTPVHLSATALLGPLKRTLINGSPHSIISPNPFSTLQLSKEEERETQLVFLKDFALAAVKWGETQRAGGGAWPSPADFKFVRGVYEIVLQPAKVMGRSWPLYYTASAQSAAQIADMFEKLRQLMARVGIRADHELVDGLEELLDCGISALY